MQKIQTYITCTTKQMVMAELRDECKTLSFLIDECRITECFSGYIVNFLMHVRTRSPYITLVDEELYPVQAWKKAS
ncbi:hypothetical protein TNCV_2449271 [Trichonephila clavipes]|uniref:Uncharacterized protein n=1 Tax=Trichonephila clavipes TaxID=2585209 RepID=A0A8X6SIC0_TRICX|nr:hypothetical protein TNCV_2449271 [Trichonephila clavipes]